MVGERRPYNRQDPLGVHVICEQIFCPRAMICTHAKSPRDDGQEPAILRLDYSPSYEVQDLEDKLSDQAGILWQLIAGIGIFLVAGWVLSFLHWSFFWAGLFACGFLARAFWQEMHPTWQLLQEQRAIARAVPMEPTGTIPQDEPVHWWSLRAAGFVANPVDNLLVDPDLGFHGRPWRILRRGNLAIPAYVRNSNELIHPQQRARIAAYCHLIRLNEGAESPYGILLDRGTFTGVAIKPSDRDFQTFQRGLRQIPRVLGDWHLVGSYPPAPKNEVICKNCPHGQPTEYQPGVSETQSYGQQLDLYRTESFRDPGTIWHCACGDHFRWIPQHRLVHVLQLHPARTG